MKESIVGGNSNTQESYESYTFVLKSISPQLKTKLDVEVDFYNFGCSAKIPENSQQKSLIPVFNRDGKSSTPGFIINLEQVFIV